MSSHREAPEISKDPVADSTDLYAFVSPDAPDTVTLIANYIPLEYPAGGPNFFEFGTGVLYRILIDNDGDGVAEVTYDFRFTTQVRNKDSFLYNTGTITSLGSPNWNRPQFYSVTRVTRDDRQGPHQTVLGSHLTCPPCNIGPFSTPNYPALAASAVHTLPGGAKVFAGQRLDGFYVDLGSIFDLADLRPFQNLHLDPRPAAPGVDSLRAFNVHSIALQVPIKDLTANGRTPTDPTAPASVIGVWTTASRQKGLVRGGDGTEQQSGPFMQVSRLGNPLFNEVIVPMGDKDRWNALPPSKDDEFAKYVDHPELAALLPILYPGVFPNLKSYMKVRADLHAILLTGLPKGVIGGFQNFTGSKPADMLRLNAAIPPAAAPKINGILAGDLAGFPNGRRVFDDVVTIELRAIAGVTIPLVDPTFTPDGAAAAVTDGVTRDPNTDYLQHFPYLSTPKSGFDVTPPQ
jgi:hypothetical protein